MSKKNIDVTNEATEAVIDTPAFVTEGVACYLVKTETGVAIRDLDGNISEDCPISKDGLAYKLHPNAANRTWFMLGKFEKEIAANPEGIPLYYRASRPTGERQFRYPNEKLMAHMTPEELEEYKAIVDDAYTRMQDAKAKPKTEIEKLQEQIERSKAKMAELLAKAANDDTVTE